MEKDNNELFTTMPVGRAAAKLALPTVVSQIIGYSHGAKDHKRVHAVCSLSFKILLIFSVVFLIIVQLIPETIVRLFLSSNGSNPEEVAKTIDLGGAFMRCWSWCVIGMSLFNMYNSIFQAVGRWKPPCCWLCCGWV